MKKLIVILVLLLAACTSPTMTNDEIIKETNKCEDAGLKAQTIYNGVTGEVRYIRCMPKEKP